MATTNVRNINSLLTTVKTQIETLPGSYRFMYTQPQSINAQYYFIGLNPAGKETDPSDLFVESGNAILNERWDASGTGYNVLQQQLIYFFEELARFLKVGEWIPFMNTEWMISNYVFYRSPRWTEMAKKKEHIDNCKSIWRMLFAHSVPKVIVTNGYSTYDVMCDLLEEFGWHRETETRSCRSWDGPHISVMVKDEQKCLLVGFAHLSTYKIMKRDENKECLQNVFRYIQRFA